MNLQKDGLIYEGREELHIPQSELDRLGIDTIQPNTKVYMWPYVMRAVEVAYIPMMRTVALLLERTRDPLPTLLSSAMTPNLMPVGEYPIGWVINDPTAPNKAVYVGGDPIPAPSAGNVIRIDNVDTGIQQDSFCYIEVQDFISHPATKISFDVNAVVVGLDGIISYFMSGTEWNIRSLQQQEANMLLGIFAIDGYAYIRDLGATVVNIPIQSNSWYHVEWEIDYWKNTLKGHIYDYLDPHEVDLSFGPFKWIDMTNGEFENIPPSIYFVLSGHRTNDLFGCEGSTVWKNIEVSSISAL